ncbi:hypothetical protein CN425_01660 [Bacillus cereus]|uniref:Uncharacterized protein n=1 Tax=Bacillus cereus TaxID=1396 RepID=A0A2A8PQ89_BACCE|nr:hypothetical protein [Bacillus cereus]EJS67791.1 hypothetical protein ICU_03017 [Bacillus cereus BAG2X1-1]EJS67860.1 hypothetical protein ICY_04804 [Bacillus cereus BAG2X1-3]EJS76114.1 hypothetical protein ICY_02865 [Bacillus cereus BAG2X1-3]PEV97032.1 hypothetical protein CN425_24830 [Bacillus cereus]PEW06869.1 hypothetical protein CN425_01660 [Bacillus cereus]
MENVVIQQTEECPTCPEGTVCEASDLLCINIPCTTTVVLLGLIRLNIGPLCIRVSSVDDLTKFSDEERLAKERQIFDELRNTLPHLNSLFKE